MGPDVGRGLLGRVPWWLWLAAIVAVSAAFRAWLARDLVAPFIFVDELIWSELARGIADAGEALLRDEPDPGYSLVYPLLISPVYAVVDGLVDAYSGVKTLNAVLMSLAAVPAYFLARRVVGTGLALLGALLAVALPSLVYTGTVMTENAFYPLFLCLSLVLVLVLERPTWARVAVLVVVLGIAFGTRVQAVALVPAVLLAPLLLAVLEGSGLRATLARYRTLYLTFAGLGMLALVGMLVSGRSPLGAYERVGDASYEVGDVLRYLVWHVAELEPLPARDPGRGDDRARSARAHTRPAAPGVPRGDTCAHRVPRPRRRSVRVGVLRPGRGTESLLRRAAVRDRSPRVGRARSGASAAARADRRGRVRAARPRHPVRAPAHDLGRHGHAHAAPVLVAPGPDRRVVDDSCGARAGRGAGRRVPARAAALRDRAPARRPRPVGGRAEADLVREARLGAVLGGVAVPGDPDRRPRLGRPGARARRAHGVPVDRSHRPAHREPERVLQPLGRPRVLRRRARRRAG